MTLKTTDNPPSCFPETIFETPAEPGEKKWWVARTKSRQEKALAWDLKAKGMHYYLPLVSSPQKCRGRMRASILPLFSGYLFFKGDQNDRYKALQSGRIAQVIDVEDQIRIEQELATLSHATLAKMDLTLCDFVRKGQQVRIIAGPFTGLEGIVRKQKNQTRLILTLEAIRQAAAVEIPLDHVQKI